MNTQKNIPPGWQRFDYFLQQLQAALAEAETTENPALSLYRKNIRPALFMLEALTRIYRGMHNKKLFDKLNERFKSFEDLLGAIDHYDGFVKEFSEKENIPATIKEYMKGQMENKLANLNGFLADGSWIGDDNKRIKKMTLRLAEADWQNEQADQAGVKKYYKKCFDRIIENTGTIRTGFHDVEKDLHELRRELRWLCIFPHALRGLIQMKPTVNSPEYLNKYLLPEVINSPYNKMPEQGTLGNFVYVNANYFYALSWLISELGTLKDNGLRIVILKEAVLAQNKGSDTDAETKALAFCGEGQQTLREILKQAREISEQFFNEKIMEQIMTD